METAAFKPHSGLLSQNLTSSQDTQLYFLRDNENEKAAIDS